MKKAPVVIKGNKSGIRIVLDDALPFPEILEEVEKIQGKFEFSWRGSGCRFL